MIDYGRFAERLAAHRANQDPARRWDLYKEFHAEWGFVPRYEPKSFSDDVRSAIGRVSPDTYDGVSGIPVALAAWMALPENSLAYGGAPSDMGYVWPPQWCLPPGLRKAGGGYSGPLDPDSPLVVPGSQDLRMVTFMADDQYIYEWAYRSADATVDDPMVLTTVEDRWAPAAPSLTEFVLTAAAVHVPIDLGWHATAPEDDQDEAVERVRATWPEMGLPFWRETFGGFTLYGGPDVVAMVAGDGELDYSDYPLLLNGRTKEAVQAAAARIGGGDWPLDQWYVWEGEL
jgi:hypothetical protein